MAASVFARVRGVCFRELTNINLGGSLKTVLQGSALTSRTSTTCSAFNNEEEYVVVARNGTIVCWHPEPKFPYEATLPMPARSAQPNSPLNVQLAKEADEHFVKKPEQFIRAELMKRTHTTKHRWFPHGEKKFAKKTKPDREYL